MCGCRASIVGLLIAVVLGACVEVDDRKLRQADASATDSVDGGDGTGGGCTLVANDAPLFVGGFDHEDDAPFSGILDEVRIASVGRSANWLTTEVNNQRLASTFLSVGPEE